MVDNELAGPNPRKTGALGSDYPQGKQRKETGLARKALFLVVSAKASPAAALAGTPRGVGISDKKKGSEIIRALQFGGQSRNRTSFRAPAQTFFTNSDFKLIAPMPSILQSMSWSPSTRRMFLTLVPTLTMSEEPLTFRSLMTVTLSPS